MKGGFNQADAFAREGNCGGIKASGWYLIRAWHQVMATFGSAVNGQERSRCARGSTPWVECLNLLTRIR